MSPESNGMVTVCQDQHVHVFLHDAGVTTEMCFYNAAELMVFVEALLEAADEAGMRTVS